MTRKVGRPKEVTTELKKLQTEHEKFATYVNHCGKRENDIYDCDLGINSGKTVLKNVGKTHSGK